MRFIKIVTFMVALLFIAGCTSENRREGYVHYRVANDPTTLDPALIVDVDGGSIAAKLFNGLVKLGDDLKIEPDIAESWEVSKDGLTYSFKIREGVRFSSGREVRAWDFKYSIERVLDPETKSPQTWIFENIVGAQELMEGTADDLKGVKVIDDRTLQISLTATFTPFLGLLSMPAAYVVPMEEVLHLGPDFSSHPVGTGPYVLREWLPNQHLMLDARKDYFGPRASVKGIIYRVISEELTAVAEFELGNLDIVTIPISEYGRYISSPEWRDLISTSEGINTYYLGLNNLKPPFDNPEIRRAVAYAIDRERILRTLYEGRARLAAGPVPDLLRTWTAPEVYPYDPVKARKLLKMAGVSSMEIEFYIIPDQQVVDIAEVIQSYLKDVGLNVKIRQLEWSAFKEVLNKGEAHMFWLSWWADYPDPENFLFPTFHSSNHGSGGNRVWYTNQEVDKLIEAAQRATSPAKRDQSYMEAERLIVADAPWVFFWHRNQYVIRQPWVKRYRSYPVYSMDKGLDIGI